MAVTIKIEGLKELDAALGALPKATGKNVLRRVLKRAGEPIAEAARRKVPAEKSTGNLKRSITVSTKLANDVGKTAFAEVMRTTGDRTAARAALRDARRAGGLGGGAYVEMYVGPGRQPHAHWIEFGTGERFHKSGKSVGRVTAQPYMRPAWDSQKRMALEIIIRDLGDEIEKAAQRIARKAARAAAKG